jgi:hypothetical protein
MTRGRLITPEEAAEIAATEVPINLNGEPPDPATYLGPLNVFIELHGTAVANNTATQTKADYDALHPEDPVIDPPPEPPLPGTPIDPGRPYVPPDPAKYVLDTSVGDRVARRRRVVRPI